MQWRTWVRLACFALIAALLVLVGRAAEGVQVQNGWWVPSVTCPLGLFLLFARRKGGEQARPLAPWLFPYALVLCLVDPSMAVSEWPHFAPVFVLPLAPLVWVGVVGMRRGERVRAVGAWLVVCGQFFALVFNKTHGGSFAGCWKSLIYLD
jgi:hypothetical protein